MTNWIRVAVVSAAALAGGARADAQWNTAAFAFAEAQEDPNYQRGTAALDAKHWQEAADAFRSVPRTNSRADAALYWRAYALNRLGRRSEALGLIGELRKEHPSSRWLNDAKALEVEVRQDTGHPVSPDAEHDDDLKLLALNSLMHSDPQRAIPILEKFLTADNPLRYKQQALFVLMQTGSPKARQIVADIARNNPNQELRFVAIAHLGLFGGNESKQVLSEIYTSSSDVRVKRKILEGFMISGDRERLLAAAKGESNAELRRTAIQQLGVMGNRTAQDLLSLYASVPDRADRRAVVQALFIQGNATALIGLARKESDPELKRAIVQQLSLMNTKESTDYMMELLNK